MKSFSPVKKVKSTSDGKYKRSSFLDDRFPIKLAVLTNRAIHGAGPSYLQSCFTRVVDMPSRQPDNDCVRPALIACTYRSFVDPQSAVAHSQSSSGVAVWNDLPAHVTAAPSLAVFRQHLKTFLFSRSYSDIVT